MRYARQFLIGFLLILALSACTVATPAPAPFTAAPLPTVTAALPATGGTASVATEQVTLPPVETTPVMTQPPLATETSAMETSTAITTLPAGAESPSASATVPAAGIDIRACLAGDWQLNGNDEYLLAVLPSILPAPVAQMGQLKKVGQTGQVVYGFGDNGDLQVSAQNFQATYSVQVNASTLKLVLGMNGTASAKYALQGDLLNVSQPRYDQMVFSGSLGGVTVSSSQLSQFIPLVNGSINAARVQCAGNQLTLQVQGVPNLAPQITFNRVMP